MNSDFSRSQQILDPNFSFTSFLSFCRNSEMATDRKPKAVENNASLLIVINYKIVHNKFEIRTGTTTFLINFITTCILYFQAFRSRNFLEEK